MELILELIFTAIRNAIEQARIRRVLAVHAVAPGALTVPEGVTAAQVDQQLTERAAELRTILAELAASGEAALASAIDLERDLEAVPGGQVLGRVLREKVRPTLEGAVPPMRALALRAAALPAGPVFALQADAGVGGLARAIQESTVQAQVLAVVAETRRVPDEALKLADADAIAAVMLEPIQAFARDYELALPVARPVAVPANPGWEAIWFGLLPDAYPILFVPAEFERDLFRYASVPHELGHLLWRDLPGLADEVGALVPGNGLGAVAVDDGQIVGQIEALYHAWISEIWADAVAIYLIGPAALRGLAHSFAQPDAPLSVLVIGLSADLQRYDEHPPPHLRIHLAAHLLAAMGFDREAAAIRAEWDKLHGDPHQLLIPRRGGGFVGGGIAPVLASGRELLDRLYMAQLESLRGFRLADIPGFEMSPGLWARVQRRAEELSTDAPFNDDGRVVLAAAIEARARRPGLAGMITRGLRRAVLGRDTSERKVADPRYARAAAETAGSWATEVRDALILREVLGPRRGQRVPYIRSPASPRPGTM